MARHERLRSLRHWTMLPSARLSEQAPRRHLPTLEDSPALASSRGAPRGERIVASSEEAASMRAWSDLISVCSRAPCRGSTPTPPRCVRASRCPLKGLALARDGFALRPPRGVAVSLTTASLPTVINRLSPSHGPPRHIVVRCSIRPPEGWPVAKCAATTTPAPLRPPRGRPRLSAFTRCRDASSARCAILGMVAGSLPSVPLACAAEASRAAVQLPRSLPH